MCVRKRGHRWFRYCPCQAIIWINPVMYMSRALETHVNNWIKLQLYSHKKDKVSCCLKMLAIPSLNLLSILIEWIFLSITPTTVKTLRPRENGRHFADDIFKCIFVNGNFWIPIKISLKFVPKDPINNISALVQIMAWRRPGDKPLSEPMMVSLLTHICVTRPQWVNILAA